MFLRLRFIPTLALVLLMLVGLLPAQPAAAQRAAQSAAQNAVTGIITPLGDSSVTGVMSVSADAQGAANIALSLIGLQPGAGARVNLNAGSCSMPSASVLNLVTVTADTAGRATAAVRVALPGGGVLALKDVADGQHVVVVIVGSVAVACGAIPAVSPGGGDTGGGAMGLGPALLAEGERRQVMQFNPNAALQKRIFADGFVPNSGEFGITLEATAFILQRAEHLQTGTVRVYFARQNDWSNVRYVQRGSADAFGRLLLDEAEQRLAIRFNPGAALQRRIFADAFVPNSPEFTITFSGTSYTGQRAEHLRTGRVRIYYAVTGLWNNVRFVERAGQGPSGATLTINPTTGPSGALVRLTGAGFPPNTRVTAWGGPLGSEGTQLGTATSDAQGKVALDVSVVGAVGMRWVFGLVAGTVHAESGEFVVTG